MEKKSVVKAYFQGLESGNYEKVVQLYAPNAVVYSPLYGKVEAVRFYKDLFSDTQKSKISLKQIFISVDDPDCVAAHFIYVWTMKDGSVVQFECIDVFEFAPESDKVKSLTIIYDTYQARQIFDKVHPGTTI